MLKIVGAICILIATSWIGFEASKAFTERPRQLRMLKSALQSLEAEIMYGHAPLHDASRRIANQISKPIETMFENFSRLLLQGDITAKEAWEISLKTIWNRTYLKKNELEILLQFGETLGKHDRIQQQKHIQLALVHLEREEVEARERQASYGNMVKNLGFLSGLFIIILLM